VEDDLKKKWKMTSKKTKNKNLPTKSKMNPKKNDDIKKNGRQHQKNEKMKTTSNLFLVPLKFRANLGLAQLSKIFLLYMAAMTGLPFLSLI
jgi:hypothetical protein